MFPRRSNKRSDDWRRYRRQRDARRRDYIRRDDMLNVASDVSYDVMFYSLVATWNKFTNGRMGIRVSQRNDALRCAFITAVSFPSFTLYSLLTLPLCNLFGDSLLARNIPPVPCLWYRTTSTFLRLTAYVSSTSHHRHISPEDEGSIFIRNVGIITKQTPRTSSSSPPWKTYVSLVFNVFRK
jgi:hypothetical protein